MNRRTPVTVLLFDARADSREAYADALRSAGWRIEEADRGDAALAAMVRSRPHVIIVAFDAETRDDRLRFCRDVKADLSSGSTPILLLTSAATGDDVELATDPGVMVLTVTPDAASKLIAAVQGVMAAQRPTPLRARLDGKRRRKSGDS